MNKKRWLTGILCGALLGGLLLGSVGMVSAAADKANTDQKTTVKSAIQSKMMKKSVFGPAQGMKMDLTSLTEDGIISSEQAAAIQQKMDQMKADMEAKKAEMQAMTAEEKRAWFKENKPEKIDFCASLVNDGIISSEQADAIQEATKAKFQEQKQAQLQEDLSSLVDKGTITADQSALIIEKLEQFAEVRQAEKEKIKNMTVAEAREYIQQLKAREKVGPLADLVNAGSLTQEQADSVMQALGRKGPANGKVMGKEMGKKIGERMGMRSGIRK